MKRSKKIGGVAWLACALSLASSALAGLTPDQKQELVQLYEEERLALELYEQFDAKWDLRPFVNIQRSERRHRQMVAALLQELDLELPPEGAKGHFEGDLKPLYEKLTQQGDASLKGALLAAALVEETDIRDLQRVHDTFDEPAVKETCKRLIAASGNHLRAFVRNYESRFGDYQAQLMPAEDVKAILEAPHARGHGKRGAGRGRGRGRGGCDE